jgi:hypothetical protein
MSRELPTKATTPRHQLIPADTRIAADLVGNLADVIAVFCRTERGDLCLVLHRLEVGPTSGSA